MNYAVKSKQKILVSLAESNTNKAKLNDRQDVLRLIAVKISIYAVFSTLSALGPLPPSPATTSKLTLSPSAIETPGLSPVA